MSRVRVPLHNNPTKFVDLDKDATQGAVYGVNLFNPDGTLFQLPEGTTQEQGEEVVNQIYNATWNSVLYKPRNITEAAALTGAGLVTRQSDGNWVVRFVEGSADRITVTNGGGGAGNPKIDLATVEDSGTGELLAFTRDGYGRVTGTRPTEPSDFPSQEINTEPGEFVEPIWDAGTSTLTANLRARTYYATISTVTTDDDFTAANFDAFHFTIEAGASLTITGLGGGVDKALKVIANSPMSEGDVMLTNDGGIYVVNTIHTSTDSDYAIKPGNAVILRYVEAEASWMFYATTGGGSALSHRVDDITAVTGDIRFRLDKMPYQDRVAIYDDGGARLKLSMQMGIGKNRYLLSPAAGGEIYTVDYWTEEANPGPTTMDAAEPVMVSGDAPDAEIGVPYSFTYTLAGGTGPYLWVVLSGALPDGLTLNSGTGEISGTPTTVEESEFVIRVTDDDGGMADTDPQSITVASAVDPYWANVSSLLYGDSATADETGRVWSVAGTITPDPSELVFGMPSLHVTVPGYLSLLGDDNAFDVEGVDWTYEHVVWVEDTANQALFSKRAGSVSFGGILPIILGGKFHLLATTSGSNWEVNFGDPDPVVPGQKYRIVYRRVGNSWQIGKAIGESTTPVLVASQTVPGSVPNNANDVQISESAFQLRAGTHIAQVRFTKGYARPFVAQTAPWPNS